MNTRLDDLACVKFNEGYVGKNDAAMLLDEAVFFQRAVQTHLLAMPLINTLGMKICSQKLLGSDYKVLPIWKKRLDAKTLVTTPNSDVNVGNQHGDSGPEFAEKILARLCPRNLGWHTKE